jgi:hypothetical protein
MKFDLSKVPTPAKVAVGLLAGFGLLALAAYYGLALLMFVFFAGLIFIKAWPVALLYLGACSGLGALITKARNNANPASRGAWSGLTFGLITGAIVLAVITVAALQDLH